MPRMSSLNGLGVCDIPDEAKDLNELEKALTSKNIFFVKTVIMPRSRWKKKQGKTVSIPIDKERLLSTLNTVNTQLPRDPRKPEESGLICVRFKRKREYKTTHLEKYVCPEKMNRVVMKYKELGHPGYADIPNIPVNNRFSVLEDEEVSSQSESDSDTDEEEEDQAEEDIQDPIRKYQSDLGGHTTMRHNYPEMTVRRDTQNDKQQKAPTVDVAPGEGVIPANMTKQKDCFENSLPHLFADGKNGPFADRDKPVSEVQYFQSRLRHISGQFGNDPLFLFAANEYIERLNLDRNINISYQRGKIIDGHLQNLKDVFSIFQKVPGSDQYWKQRKDELVAKLKQLGPFQFFFTLSCADKRWDEIFVSILRKKGLKIIYEAVKEKDQKSGKFAFKAHNIYVQEDGKDRVLLEDYLKNENRHELVRQNVLAVTMIFDRRVHAFMKNIAMAPSSPMKAEYYTYRVEFQLRGAAHIHGVLWIDLPELEKTENNEV